MYAMMACAMRMILAWYSPHKGQLPTLGFPAHRIIKQFGQNVLDELVKTEHVSIDNGKVIPTKGGRAAFMEPTQLRVLEGRKGSDEIDRDMDRRLRRRLSALHLFT